MTEFRFGKKGHEATCTKCGRWRLFSELIWPIDPEKRDQLMCQKCRAKLVVKIKRIPVKYIDSRTGHALTRRFRCDTCDQLKPPRSYYLIPGTILLRLTCIACERELNRLNRQKTKR